MCFSSGRLLCFVFFFFNDTATTEIYTLSLHDALPISECQAQERGGEKGFHEWNSVISEEHTSELQSPKDLVCRLLLEKKKKHKGQAVPMIDPLPRGIATRRSQEG